MRDEAALLGVCECVKTQLNYLRYKRSSGAHPPTRPKLMVWHMIQCIYSIDSNTVLNGVVFNVRQMKCKRKRYTRHVPCQRFNSISRTTGV